MDLGVDRTPTDRFFVCSGSAAPIIDRDKWKLTVGGDAVAAAVELSFEDLQSLPRRRLDAWLECAGNGRAMYSLAGGHEPSPATVDTAWVLGGMGMASWTGVAVRDVLALAGIGPDAAWVSAVGGDLDNVEGEPAGMCMPLTKALDPDTLIATTMNDEPLLPAHGAPVRLLVPGWVGAYSVKWLASLEVSASWVPSWRADVYYRLRTPDGVDLGPATAHPIKSCLALDWPADLSVGPQRIGGYARSGGELIDCVEVSVDDGPWFEAPLSSEPGRWGWRPFAFDWDAEPGAHQIRSRAWDVSGATQPESMAYHPNTILWNAVTPHPVMVR